MSSPRSVQTTTINDPREFAPTVIQRCSSGVDVSSIVIAKGAFSTPSPVGQRHAMLGNIRGVLLRVELRTHIAIVCIMCICVKARSEKEADDQVERRGASPASIEG